MNELIERLAEQATIKEEYYPAGCNGYPEYRYDFDKEKFARLIAAECASICYDEDFVSGSGYAREITKRFGVEE